MDDWPYPYQDIDVPDAQPTLRFEDGRVMGARRSRAQQAEAARVAELEQTQTVDIVGNHTEANVPLPFATPPGVAPTF